MTSSADDSASILDAKALQMLLSKQALPALEVLPVTETSHPFNGAAWQNVPIDLDGHGYVETEYLVSGTANVYDWVAGSDFHTRVLRCGPFATRLLVRRPAHMSSWSGRVVVELLNSTEMYDWAAVWSALWEQLLAKRDVYVGITAKPAVFPGLQRFDAVRYAGLAMANPLPPDQQAGGSMPGDLGYDPNISRLYENGLIWDIVTQTGRLLRSDTAANPLGKPARLVVLSGESQQANYLASYYKWFAPAAHLPNGRPLFDGYLADCQTNPDPQTGPYMLPINQAAAITDPLPDDDPQLGWVPGRPVPWMALSSQWDYAAARGFAQPQNSDTATHKARFWDLAGSNHSWEWQCLYGDACAGDLVKAGVGDPGSYDWHTTMNNPEVPLHMAEKAAYEALVTWVTEGVAPPVPEHILSEPNDPSFGLGMYRDAAVYDEFGNARGGLRMPMVAVPIAGYGEGRDRLTPPHGLTEIVPFSGEMLAQLYISKADYVEKYTAVAMELVQHRYLLLGDALKLIAQADAVTSIPG